MANHLQYVLALLVCLACASAVMLFCRRFNVSGRGFRFIRQTGKSREQCSVSSAMGHRVLNASNRELALVMRRLRHDRSDHERIPGNPPPSDCGRKARFQAANTRPGDPFEELEVAESVLLKLGRQDLLCEMREAVAELERQGAFEANSYCGHFSSCGDSDMSLISEHSRVYFVCPSLLKHVHKFTRENASRLFEGGGATTRRLPGRLGKEGDDNVLCQLAKWIVEGMEKQVLPRHGLPRQQCIVQEFFVNRQRSGAFTNPHQHHDDFFGGIYYLDAPPSTRLCYDNNRGDYLREAWERHAPGFVTDFGNQQHSAGYAEVKPGDILLAPVTWLKHWVPPLEEPNATRTSIVFNMNCIQAPPEETRGQFLQMPALGFGTCGHNASRGPALQRALSAYLRAGGRRVDTAASCRNHDDVGYALKKARLLREEFWVTDKLAANNILEAREAIDRSLIELGVTHVDLMLVEASEDFVSVAETWRAMLEARGAGKLKHIGVSGFNETQLDRLLREVAGAPPEVSELWISPSSAASLHEFVRSMQQRGIVVVAKGLMRSHKDLRHPGCAALAQRYGKTARQVLLRWALDRGMAVAPGTASDLQIEENLDVQDFKLREEELAALESPPA